LVGESIYLLANKLPQLITKTGLHETIYNSNFANYPSLPSPFELTDIL